jgi:hypothetical protein
MVLSSWLQAKGQRGGEKRAAKRGVTGRKSTDWTLDEHGLLGEALLATHQRRHPPQPNMNMQHTVKKP